MLDIRSVSIKGHCSRTLTDSWIECQQEGWLQIQTGKMLPVSLMGFTRTSCIGWRREILSHSVKGLDAWTKNQDVALKDEVTRSVLAFGNATYGGRFVCLPDLRDVTRKKQFWVGGEQNYVEWDGVLCNGMALLLVEAKQRVSVNLRLQNSSGRSPNGAQGDTLDLVLDKLHKFQRALRAGELEHQGFDKLKDCKILVFLGARLFSENAKKACLRKGVSFVFPSGDCFIVSTR